jgi:copper chaperone CopZ
MIRRQFIKLATLTGATGLTSLGALEAMRNPPTAAAASNHVESVTWHVSGFTCVTCAVGLETLLRREKGVVDANATYPQSMVTIHYHPDVISQDKLRSAIAELGFTADDKKG